MIRAMGGCRVPPGVHRAHAVPGPGGRFGHSLKSRGQQFGTSAFPDQQGGRLGQWQRLVIASGRVACDSGRQDHQGLIPVERRPGQPNVVRDQPVRRTRARGAVEQEMGCRPVLEASFTGRQSRARRLDDQRMVPLIGDWVTHTFIDQPRIDKTVEVGAQGGAVGYQHADHVRRRAIGPHPQGGKDCYIDRVKFIQPVRDDVDKAFRKYGLAVGVEHPSIAAAEQPAAPPERTDQRGQVQRDSACPPFEQVQQRLRRFAG